MAGFWHLSHHQLRDANGRVYDGARAYFYRADTLEPITVYADYSLGTTLPNPVQANGVGIFPPVFFDEEDNFYRQRITSKTGVIIEGTDIGTLPIIGPSGGGGGSEVPVDANSLLKTGDPLWVPVSGTRAGFVRLNGRTIGASGSGASERANADTELLYTFNWQNFSDTLCPVTGGRGSNAPTDFAANKPIGLLDMRGRGPFGMTAMGNTDNAAFAAVPFTAGDGATAASLGGEALHTLTVDNLPPHPHDIDDPGHDHGINLLRNSPAGGGGNGVSASAVDTNQNKTLSATTGITVLPAGGGGAHNNMPLFMLGTWYQRL